MAQFLNRIQLTDELEKIITEAQDYLLLISPYFKLNNSIKDALAQHRNNKNFEIVIVYGKNEEDRAKSLSDSDLEFFKSFQNVQIGYHKKLHAKIYVNESSCLLTSMNLHDFSMKNNVEFGILTQSKTLDVLSGFGKSLNIKLLSGSLDQQAFDFCESIIDESTIEFKKEVKKEKSFFGLFTKNGNASVDIEINRHGYCIRTAAKIPFNLERPYSAEAFKSWNQYRNAEYSEKFCHQCGNRHKSSMNKPICFDCQQKK